MIYLTFQLKFKYSSVPNPVDTPMTQPQLGCQITSFSDPLMDQFPHL